MLTSTISCALFSGYVSNETQIQHIVWYVLKGVTLKASSILKQGISESKEGIYQTKSRRHQKIDHSLPCPATGNKLSRTYMAALVPEGHTIQVARLQRAILWSFDRSFATLNQFKRF